MKTKLSSDDVRRAQAGTLAMTLAGHQPTYPAVFEQDRYHVPCSCGAKVDAGRELWTLNDAYDAFAGHQAALIKPIFLEV